MGNLLSIVIILAVCYVIGADIQSDPIKQATTRIEDTRAAADRLLIRNAHANVLAKLRDPASAVFETATRYPGGAVCGIVRARNGFGGYNRIIYAASTNIGGQAFVDVTDRDWLNRHCKD